MADPNLNPAFDSGPAGLDLSPAIEAGVSFDDVRQPMLPKPVPGGSSKNVGLPLPRNVGFFHPTKALYRWAIMVCISMLSVSGYYLYDNIGSMEQTIEDAINITPGKFGLLYSVYSLPNTVMPFIGGFLVDQISSTVRTLVCLAMAFLGTCMIAVAPSLPNAFYWMVAGRFLFGLGTETSYVAQNTVLCKWFGTVNNELALAMGLSVSAGRLGAFLTFNVNVLVADSLGFQAALFLGAALSGLALVGGILYVILDYAADKEMKKYQTTPDPPAEPINFRIWESVPRTPDFWVLSFLTVIYYAAIFPFQSLATTLLEEKYDMDPKLAARIISVLPLTSLILSPLFGLIVDRIKLRALLSTIGILVTLPSFLVLATTSITPIPSISAIGLAYSLVPAAIWPCIPLLVPEHMTATAFGLLSAFINTALTAIYYVVPLLSPFNQLLLFSGLAVIGTFLGVIWNILDHNAGRKVN